MIAADSVPIASAAPRHDPDDLIRLFNATFTESERTVLARGDDEPIYLPADDAHPYHRILFAHGFFASALHEIAHWCIAGEARRRLVDYGYWYRPDGRTASEQAEFERVEARPQAVEWLFCRACGLRFRVSADNLSGESVDPNRFRRRVFEALTTMRTQGFPPRALRFAQRLSDFYGLALRLPEQWDDD